ncbi:MAG: cytochrome c biogenesis protein ResB [Pontiellaceae bacterium]|nr:cytochrome c biogenesis protein ResB [Pontiellaceae bacterium]MBN2785021.1 cytochrome c biogenesis protein ResB [Pontiellaceae bacterium]
MNKVIDFFLSLKLTVVLLALGMVLVFAGTLAQVDRDIWTVMEQYFRCYIAYIDLYIFFPRNWNIPHDLRIPFPGGFLIGCLLSLNLIAVHSSTFKVLARGRRLTAGLLALILGVIVVAGVMFGWGTAPVAITEDDAFWRVFFRLGRGTLAAGVLFFACHLLYRQRAGMVMLHGGILFLLIGEFVTAHFAVESSMTLEEGETVSYVDRTREFELAFTETTDPARQVVTAIPHRMLKNGDVLHPAGQPFDIKVHRYMLNSNSPVPLDNVPAANRDRYPAYEGYGSRLYIAAKRSVSGTMGERNAPAVDVELIDRESGASLGRYILTTWFYPNFVKRAWDMPTHIGVGGRSYEVYFRPKREYLKSPSGSAYAITLLDFRHERYEGTQMPRDFSSEIRLVNQGDEVDRELRIWMNNPLRYARRTFYQSGYLPDDSGTVLQVVRNDVWMIPYLSCMIVFVGMTAQFILTFRHYLRRDN